jgi:hypothetical protein
MAEHDANPPPEWAAWTKKHVLGVLSRTEWRTFKEITAAMGPKRAVWMNQIVVRGIVRSLVAGHKVLERIRSHPGGGRGCDEFRRVR